MEDEAFGGKDDAAESRKSCKRESAFVDMKEGYLLERGEVSEEEISGEPVDFEGSDILEESRAI